MTTAIAQNFDKTGENVFSLIYVSDHEMYDRAGFIIEGCDIFDPIDDSDFLAVAVAHDTIEHDNDLGCNGETSELCALGAAYHTRHRFGTVTDQGLINDIISIISSLQDIDLADNDDEIQEIIDQYIPAIDHAVDDDFRELVIRAFSDIPGEFWNLENPMCADLVERYAGWISFGYDAAIQRFGENYNPFETVTDGFNDGYAEIMSELSELGYDEPFSDMNLIMKINGSDFTTTLVWEPQQKREFLLENANNLAYC